MNISYQKNKCSDHCKSYFKMSRTVLIDTLQDVYCLKQPKKQDSESTITKLECGHPKFTKWTRRTIKYGYWFGLARIGTLLSSTVGSTLAYTLTVYHPFFVGAGVKYVRSKNVQIADPQPKTIIAKLNSLAALLKPDRATQVLTFSILEVASLPAFVAVIEKIAELAKGTVSPLLAVTSVTAGMLTATAIEYVGFRTIWKNFVLRGIESGSVKDELEGFLKEFSPLRLFVSRKSEPAENTNEYIGQIWGVIESYWIWIQVGRLAIAATLTSLANLDAREFVTTFMTVLIGGFAIFVDLIIPRYVEGMQKKLKENNEHLGLD